MGQQMLIYSFVARGTMILAEYTEFKGNFTTIAYRSVWQSFPLLVTNSSTIAMATPSISSSKMDSGFLHVRSLIFG
ncbi:hypothetical protein ABFX02_07G060900 [Erythranthe guttata]